MGKLMALVIASALVYLPITSFAEEVKLIDIRADAASTGHYVVFVSKRGEGQRVEGQRGAGNIVVALGSGEKPDAIEIESAYGMYMDGDLPKAGPRTAEDVTALRGMEETLTLITQIDGEQAKKVNALIEKWLVRDNADDPPDSIVLDLTVNVLMQLEMKRPYRSRGGDPVVYYEDIATLNRGVKRDS